MSEWGIDNVRGETYPQIILDQDVLEHEIKHAMKNVNPNYTVSEYCCSGCREEFNSKDFSALYNHKKSCDLFWSLDDIHPNIHNWAKDLSIDRYDVWVINKTLNTYYFYTINHLQGNSKEPVLDLIQLQNTLQKRTHADIIHDDDHIMIFVKYQTVLTRKEKQQLKESLSQCNISKMV